MALFLVQHGVNLPRAQDPEKGLSPEGTETTRRIAEVAAGYKIPVSVIVHSPKKRAEQTALIFQEHLGVEAGLKKISGINPMDSVETFAASLDPSDGMMVVGHLPFMEKLVSCLTTGIVDFKLYRFQNSGVVCLDQAEGRWFIKWALNPDIS